MVAVTTLLAGLFAAALLMGAGPSSHALPHTATGRRPESETCISDRSGHFCARHPILETEVFAFSPDGRSAYSIEQNLNESFQEPGGIWIYDRDPVTGSVTQKKGIAGCVAEGRLKGCQPGRALKNGIGTLTVSPDGRNVYAATDKGLAIFDRDLQTGALTQKPGAEGCLTSIPKSAPTCGLVRSVPGAGQVKVSPDGRNVYVTGDGLVVFDRDTTTGVLTQKPGREGIRSGAGSFVISPDGKNVYASTIKPDGIVAFARDPATGILTRVPGPAGCVSVAGQKEGCRRGHELGAYLLTISPDGRNVYGLGEVVQKIGVLDVLDRLPDGTLTQKPGRAGCIGGEGRRACRYPGSLGEVRGVTAGSDGKLVWIFEYPYPGEGEPFIRHPSGELTEAQASRH